MGVAPGALTATATVPSPQRNSPVPEEFARGLKRRPGRQAGFRVLQGHEVSSDFYPDGEMHRCRRGGANGQLFGEQAGIEDAPPVDPDGRVGNAVAERLGQTDETAASGSVRRGHDRDDRHPAFAIPAHHALADCRRRLPGVPAGRGADRAQCHAQQTHRAYVGVEETLHARPDGGGVEVAVRLGQHDGRGGEGDREVVQERLPLG